MKIASIRVAPLRIPFRAAFSHSAATRLETQGVLVEATSASGATGYGESAPREYVTGETVEGTLQGILEAGRGLTGSEVRSLEELGPRLGGLAPAVRTALELALLDLWSREKGRPLLELLGGAKRETLEYSAIVESSNGPTLEKFLIQAARFGFSQAKIKLTRDAAADRERIERTRAVLGAQVVLRGDANACWTPDEARERLPELADLGLELVEEPIPRAARDSLPALCRDFGSRIGIMADETVCSLADAEWLVAHEAVTAFNLKIGKHGGLLASIDLHAYARRSGIACQLGCFVGETSILAAAGAMLGALAGDLTSHEGATAPLLLERDIVATPLAFGYRGILPVAALRNVALGEVQGLIEWRSIA